MRYAAMIGWVLGVLIWLTIDAAVDAHQPNGGVR